MTKKAITRRDETFNTEKMMRYDDFTDEDVGNIVMDAEPLPEGCRIFQLIYTRNPASRASKRARLVAIYIAVAIRPRVLLIQ